MTRFLLKNLIGIPKPTTNHFYKEIPSQINCLLSTAYSNQPRFDYPIHTNCSLTCLQFYRRRKARGTKLSIVCNFFLTTTADSIWRNTRIRKFTKLPPNAFFDTTRCLVLYLFSNMLKSLVSWYAESTYVRAKHNELWLKSIQ